MDHKGTLQNFYMRLLRCSNCLIYSTSPLGPPFTAVVRCPAVYVGHMELDPVEAHATGPTKKEAEKRAAEAAINVLASRGYDVFNPRGLPRGLAIPADASHVSPEPSLIPPGILHPTTIHPPTNPKTYLNEFFQKALRVSKCLSYSVTSLNGDLSCLLETPPLLDVSGHIMFPPNTFIGTGTTKAEAEGAAAKQALEKLVEYGLVDPALPPLPPLNRFSILDNYPLSPSIPSGPYPRPPTVDSLSDGAGPSQPALLLMETPPPGPKLKVAASPAPYTQSLTKATPQEWDQRTPQEWDQRTASPSTTGGPPSPPPDINQLAQQLNELAVVPSTSQGYPMLRGGGDRAPTQKPMLFAGQEMAGPRLSRPRLMEGPRLIDGPMLKPGVYQLDAVGKLEPLACPEPSDQAHPGALVAVRSNPKGTLQELYMKAVKSSGAVMFQWGHWLESGMFGARVTCPSLESGYLVLPELHGEGRGRSKKGAEQNAANEVLKQLEGTYGVRRGGVSGCFVVVKGTFAFVL